MKINGTVRRDGSNWYVDHSYPSYSEPVMLTVAWRVTGVRRQANYGPAPEMAHGLAVTHETGANGWQAYERGSYLLLDTENEGTISEAPIPAPKVRKGMETRYRDGRWEKLTARGWVAA